MDAHLRAGLAVYNAGRYHAAHDAWEDYWLDLDDGDDERFLHGLIQFTAVVHHGTGENWSGAQGLAESAGEYLAALPADYRGLRLGPVRSFLAGLATDPELVERRPPVGLEHEGTPLSLSDLDFGPTAIGAVVMAEEFGYDEEPIEQARAYARRDLEAGADDSQFIALLFDFVREGQHRGIVFQRLDEHVGRRQAREEDVDGLF